MATNLKLELLNYNSNQITIDSDWKGLKVLDGEQTHFVSMDSVWKKERRNLEKELKAFYN